MRRYVWLLLIGLCSVVWATPLPVQAADSVTAIAAGPYHSCAVMNKQVWCWGKNTLGQLGDGTTTNRAGAVRVIKESDGLPLQNATAVDASVGHSCAIVDKQVWCWGANFEGKLGDGTTIDRLGAVLVQKSDSTTLDNVTAIALGYHFSCAISNAQVWCWGDNQEGEIGNGTTTSATAGAVLADYGSTAFTNVTKISAGRKHICAISEGKAYCWGTNDEGQLGIGTTSAYELYPAHVREEGGSEALTGFTDIAAGWAHSCGVVNKYVYCWGWNTSGQLGVNDSGVHISARKSLKTGGFSYANASRIVVGSPFSCVLEAQAVWCTGENANGALATNTLTSTTVGVASQYRGGGFLTGVTDITTGLSHACAIIKKQAWCWGENTDGQLGDGTTEDRLGAVRVAFDESVTAVVRNLQPATAVSGGLNQSCAVVNKQAYCWGDNTNGELGNAGALAYTSARVVVTAAGAPLTNVTAVSSGYSHACAVANKQAYCWGTNGGELGDNTTTNRTGAVAVQTATGTLTGVTAISAGTNLSCAIANKQAYCWGNNFYGGVGDGTNVDKLVATLVVNATAPLTKVTAIAAGYGHACAVANKIVYCWGVNGVGQIGNNSLVNVALATEVQLDGGLLLNKATDVGVGDENSCAINNKQVYCWGVNGSGQVGDGTTTNRRVATRVMVDATTPLGAATQLGVGGYHACALVSKQVYCWGDNGDGQLGDGNSGTQSVYAVAAKYLASDVQLTGVTQVKAGYYHTCAVIAKQVWCWGANGSNQLGDDTSTDRKGAVKSLFHRILLTQLKGL